MSNVTILTGDCREVLPTVESGSIQCVVTSPPYFALRAYLSADDPNKALEIGSEATPTEYIERLVCVFREVWRVLRSDGVLWVNIGDSYCANPPGNRQPRAEQGNGRGLLRIADQKHQDARQQRGVSKIAFADEAIKRKDLIGIPWMLAFALRADGWYLRQEIIWEKPNSFPESVTDRPTRSHEQLFLLAKSGRYYFDASAIAEASVRNHSSGNGYKCPEQLTRGGRGSDAPWTPRPLRNRRSVWRINTTPYPQAHYAVFPEALIEPCILAGSRPGDTVLDPFFGTGTTGRVAIRHGRRCIGIELNPAYVTQAEDRTNGVQLEMSQ